MFDDSFVASMRLSTPLLGSALLTTQSLPPFAFGIVMRLGALNSDLSEMPCCTAALNVNGFIDEPAWRPLPPPPGTARLTLSLAKSRPPIIAFT